MVDIVCFGTCLSQSSSEDGANMEETLTRSETIEKRLAWPMGLGQGLIFGVESCCGVRKNAAVAVVGGGRADFGAIFDAFVFLSNLAKTRQLGRRLGPGHWPRCLGTA